MKKEEGGKGREGERQRRDGGRERERDIKSHLKLPHSHVKLLVPLHALSELFHSILKPRGVVRIQLEEWSQPRENITKVFVRTPGRGGREGERERERERKREKTGGKTYTLHVKGHYLA